MNTRNRIISFIMSALLVLVMLPVSLSTQVSAEPAQTAETGVVQQADDIVVVVTGNSTAANTGARVKNAAPIAKTKAEENGGTLGRVIFLLKGDTTWDKSGHFGNADISDQNDYDIVYTSKVTITDNNRVYKSNALGTQLTSESAAYENGRCYNYFDNEDSSQNVVFDVTAGSANYMVMRCQIYFDFITFKFSNIDFLFYLCNFNTVFGEHFVCVPPSGSDAHRYPIIVNARTIAEPTKDVSGNTVTVNQTIKVLGGDWQYVSPRSRATVNTYSGSTFNLYFGGTAVIHSTQSSGVTTTCFVGGDNVINSTYNVYIQDHAQISYAALFGCSAKTSTSISISNTTLNVNISGRPRLDNGLVAHAAGDSNYAYYAPTGTTVNVTIAADATPTIRKKISGGEDSVNADGVEGNVSSNALMYPESTFFDQYTTYTDLYAGSPIVYTPTADSTGIKVYVDSNRSDYTDCTGVDADHPLPNLAGAFNVLKGRGGEILIVNTVYNQVADYCMPVVGHPVTITSADNDNQGLLIINNNIRFYDDITFDNVAIARTGDVKMMFMNYNDLTVSESCTNYTYEIDGNGYAVKKNLFTPSFDKEGKLIIIAGAYAAGSELATYGTNVEVDQTIVLNAGEYTSVRLGSKSLVEGNYYYEDKASGLTGAKRIVLEVGGSAVVQSIDAQSKCTVSVQLPIAAIGRIKLNNAAKTTAPVTGQLDIYTPNQSDLSWITASDEIEWLGFSLRDHNGGSRAFAIRGEFRQTKDALDNADEVGVLIRNSKTSTALEVSNEYTNGYGKTYVPADYNVYHGVGKSIVYLRDQTDKTHDYYNGIRVDNKNALILGVLSYDKDNYSNKDTSYDFRAYASFALEKEEGGYTLYTVYSDTHTNSLSGVATNIAANGTAEEQVVASNCLTVIG